jgi:hypothetical protein
MQSWPLLASLGGVSMRVWWDFFDMGGTACAFGDGVTGEAERPQLAHSI